MAEQIIKRLVDDIDHTKDAEHTVQFSVGNKSYKMDLSEEHYAEFMADQEKWTKHAEPVTQNKTYKTQRSGAVSRIADAEIRAWAIKSGQFETVPDRGRIRNEILEAYNKAHK